MRILVVQLADIGDLVLSTPALSALREAQPGAHIALLVFDHTAPLVVGTGLIDEIITFKRQQFNNSRALFRPGNLRRIFALRKRRYDVVVFFHHFTLKIGTAKFWLIARACGAKRRVGLQNGNGWFLTESIPDEGFGAMHQAQYWLNLVGLLDADTSPRPARISIDHDFDITGRTVGHSPMRKETTPLRVVVHPGSGGYSLARRWNVIKFAAVADALHEEYGAQIVLVGGPFDDSEAVKAAMKTEPLDLTGKTTLPELASVIRQAGLFIGADSGVMHIAAAVGTPLLALFGPSNPDAWGPWMPGGRFTVVRSAPECSPCSYVTHRIGLRDGCSARTCMRMITPEQVMKAARALLEGDGSRSTPPASPQLDQSRNRVRILGLPVDAITYDQWLTRIKVWIDAPRQEKREKARHVCTTNPEFIMMAQKDVNFRHILSRADLCVPDGVGLLWAAKRLGTPLPERVTGSDGVPKIAERAAKEGWRLFLLGAAPGVAAKAAQILQEQNPGLTIAGTYSGSPAPEEEDEIAALINASQADILFVAYGAPKQDKWIARNLPRLQVSMAMGVGGAFDFIAGVVPRAPMWMRNAGLEWLYRLYLQPSRIGRMTRLPRFVIAVLRRGAD